MTRRGYGFLVGVVFGVTLCWTGMSSPNVIRDALLFKDSYLFLFFISALVTAFVGLRVLKVLQARAVLTGEPIAWTPVAPERRLDWRAFFLFGLVVGAIAFTLIAGGPDFHGYGWLTDTFTGGARWVVAPILFAAGILIGFGAKTAGGCTSGNGLSGTSMTSPAALAATATFFGTAIVVSFAIEALT